MVESRTVGYYAERGGLVGRRFLDSSAIRNGISAHTTPIPYVVDNVRSKFFLFGGRQKVMDVTYFIGDADKKVQTVKLIRHLSDFEPL
jgi:hypothetical protein